MVMMLQIVYEAGRALPNAMIEDWRSSSVFGGKKMTGRVF
jgi:hypothetical protein